MLFRQSVVVDQCARLLLARTNDPARCRKRHRSAGLKSVPVVEAGVANNLRDQGVNAIALVLLQEGIAAWRQRQCNARNDQQVLHARTGGQKHH